MQQSNWQQTLQFLHRQFAQKQQRQLDRQLERQLFIDQIHKIQSQLKVSRQIQQKLLKRISMLQASIKQFNPKSINFIHHQQTTKFVETHSQFINKVIKDISDMHQGYIKLQQKSKVLQSNKIFQQNQILKGHLDSIRQVKFVQQNKILSVGDDCQMILWNQNSIIKSTRQHLGPIFCLSVSKKQGNQILFSGGLQNQIIVHQINNNSLDVIGKIKSNQQNQPIWDLSYDSGLLMSIQGDKKIRIYDITTHSFSSKLRQTFPNKLDIKMRPCSYNCGIFDKFTNTAIASLIQQKAIAIHNIDSKGVQYLRYKSDESVGDINQIKSAHWNKTILSAHQDSTVKVFDQVIGKVIKSINAHRQGVSCISQLDNYLISGGYDGIIKIWDMRTWKQLFYIKGHQRKYDQGVVSLQFDGNRIISGGADGLVKIFKIKEL